MLDTDIPLEDVTSKKKVHQPLINYVNERKNKLKPKTCCGRIFTHWSQIFTDTIVVGGVGVAIYEFVNSQQVIAAIVAAMAVCGVFLHFLITCFVPRKRVEQELDQMEKNADRFVIVEQNISKEKDKQEGTLHTITVIQGDEQKDIKLLKDTTVKMEEIRKEDSKENNATKKQLEECIKQIEEQSKIILQVTKKNEEFEKICEQNKLEESRLKNELEEYSSMNKSVEKNVQTLGSETTDLNKVDEKLGGDISQLKDESSQLKELLVKFQEISKANAELEEKLRKTTEERNEFEEKLKQINENLKKGTQELESTAKELIEKISTKEKELQEVIKKTQEYSLRYEEIKKKLNELQIKLEGDNNEKKDK